MKARNAVVILLAVFCLVALCAAPSYAAEYVCTVEEVGPSGNNATAPVYYVSLSSTDAGWPGPGNVIKCKIDPARGKEYLAAALTAVASGKTAKVKCNADLALPIVTSFSVMK
jgi:hypothetical protein